jgi:hypothetical protein
MKSFKVYLNVYDFTSCNCCLSCLGLGGYHTGIEIEYPPAYPVMRSTVSTWSPPTPTRRGSSSFSPKLQTSPSIVSCTSGKFL